MNSPAKSASRSSVITRVVRLSLAGTLLLSPAGLAQNGKKDQAKKAAPALPTVPFATDKGRFRVVVDGLPVATDEFQISRNGSEWSARGTVDITSETGGTRITSHLRVRNDGTPVKYEVEVTPPDGKRSSVNVVFDGTTARIETQMAGSAAFTQEFYYESPRVVILDNNLYHQYALLARMFDWKAKGAQTFQVLIPQDLTPGSITLEYVGPQTVGGSKLEALRMKSTDLEVFLYADSNHRLMRLAVPGSKAEVIRE